MAVEIKKEQALFLGVLILGVWLGRGYMTREWSAPRVRAQTKDYQQNPALPPFLAGAEGQKPLPNDVFLEPSETRPLPPADLPFPALGKLRPVLLPLPIGQQAGAFAELRGNIKKVLPAEKSETAPAAAQNTGAGAGGGAGGAVQDPQSPEMLAKSYDRLVMADNFRNFWGYFVGSDDQKYELGARPGPYPEGTKIKFVWMNTSTGKEIRPAEEYKGHEVKALQLAKTLRNEVELRDRAITWNPSQVLKQERFIRWLVEQARKETWVFTKAMQRLNKHIECSSQDPKAYRLMVYTMRAMGDLESEWKLYQKLPAKMQNSAFRYRGMGELQARLGLTRLAEENLRKAVSLQPINPWNRDALARFLLDQGRPKEALQHARRGGTDRSMLDWPEEKLALDTTRVRAHLAVGDTAGARAAVPVDLPEFAPHSAYLRASVDYAAGDVAKALTGFSGCAQSGKVPDAYLGIAACQLRSGKVIEAEKTFLAVAEENPRLRHLALAGLGVAQEHVQGEETSAVQSLEAAREANPIDAYVLYMLGRQQRLNGDLTSATETLREALVQRDDLLSAMGELALTYYRLFKRDSDPAALGNAVRYIDRLVASEAATLNGNGEQYTNLYREMQGLFHFEAGDLRGARAAFDSGKNRSHFCKIGVAIVDYKQRRYENARNLLRQMARELPLDHPSRRFAEGLLARMDAHDNLEQIEFAFEHKLPKQWKTKPNGRVKPASGKTTNGVLRIKGTMRQKGEVKAWRVLSGAGRLVSLSFELVNKDDNGEFTGLEINDKRSGARGAPVPSTFRALIGFNDRGQAFIQILDGRNAKPEENEPVPFKDVTIHKDQMNQVLVEAVAGSNDKVLNMRVSWNGKQVFERQLKRLRRGTRGGQLNLEFKAVGGAGHRMNVEFDNFRLVQLKDN